MYKKSLSCFYGAGELYFIDLGKSGTSVLLHYAVVFLARINPTAVLQRFIWEINLG